MPKLVIDEDRLRGLLENIVVKTRSFKVEQLEKLHCLLSQCIYHHRKEYNKTQLVQVSVTAFYKWTIFHIFRQFSEHLHSELNEMAIRTECIYLYTFDFFVKFTLLCFRIKSNFIYKKRSN